MPTLTKSISQIQSVLCNFTHPQDFPQHSFQVSLKSEIKVSELLNRSTRQAIKRVEGYKARPQRVIRTFDLDRALKITLIVIELARALEIL